MARPRRKFGPDALSGTRIDKAGRTLRRWWLNPTADNEAQSPPEVITAWLLVFFGYRPTFQTPLDKVHMQLTRWALSITGDPSMTNRVGQRLKRENQIMDKLTRHPTMRLSTMQDIGGCRCVLPNQEKVRELVDRVDRAWNVVDRDDYVARPTKHGYRATHLVVLRDDRLVEIQLRTPQQHEWAVAVERTGNRLRMPLKFGRGDADLLRYFQLASHGIALDERGEEPDEGFWQEFQLVREQVQPHFERK